MDLISIHIPKTAGTSFRRVLHQAYGVDAVAEDYADRPDNPLQRFDDLSLPREPLAEMLAGKKAVHGHFKMQKYTDIFPEAKLVTWLRNPVSTVVSRYYYLKTVEQKHQTNRLTTRIHNENLSLLDFARLPDSRNRFKHRLGDARIDDFFFVGISEHFEEDVQDLAEMLGWSETEAPHLNRTQHESYARTIDIPTMEQIHELNLADIELHKRALQLRRQRLRAMQSSQINSTEARSKRTGP